MTTRAEPSPTTREPTQPTPRTALPATPDEMPARFNFILDVTIDELLKLSNSLSFVCPNIASRDRAMKATGKSQQQLTVSRHLIEARAIPPRPQTTRVGITSRVVAKNPNGRIATRR